jgi:hypothetical protein
MRAARPPAVAGAVLAPARVRPALAAPAGAERSPVLQMPRTPRQLPLPLFGPRRG